MQSHRMTGHSRSEPLPAQLVRMSRDGASLPAAHHCRSNLDCGWFVESGSCFARMPTHAVVLHEWGTGAVVLDQMISALGLGQIEKGIC